MTEHQDESGPFAPRVCRVCRIPVPDHEPAWNLPDGWQYGSFGWTCPDHVTSPEVTQ